VWSGGLPLDLAALYKGLVETLIILTLSSEKNKKNYTILQHMWYNKNTAFFIIIE